MKKNNSIFQWAVLGVFFFLALIGFLLFSNYKGSDKKGEVEIGEVVIWGTLDSDLMERLLTNLRDGTGKKYANVVYVEKNKNSYKQDILEALAAGESPDLIVVSNEDIYDNLNKIMPVPYTSFARRDFLNTYVEAFEPFTSDSGILAIPFIIDPMVMYYNRAIFKTVAVPLPPKHWQEFFGLSKKVTLLDEKENIKRATIAFGESVNVNNLKGILSTLMMQLGNRIVKEDGEGWFETDKWVDEKRSPVPGMLFFTEFSNPTNPVYSWNRSMPDSLDYFLSGRLATYFGFASETPRIRFKNPNLNFDVAEIPSVEKLDNKTVFAKIWGLAIPKSPGVNVTGAFHTAIALSGQESQSYLSDKLKLPPVRKDLLSQRPEDAFMDIFYREAIYASSFIDPNWKETEKIFKFMIESITGGRETPQAAVREAFDEIDLILQETRKKIK